MNTQRGQHINTFIAAIFIVFSLAVIVLIALGMDMLWQLIGGIFAVGLIMIGLASVGVMLVRVASDPVVKIISARLDMQHEANRHDEEYLRRGFVLDTSGYQQIEAPSDIPVSLQGITAEQLAEFKIHAVNLLALSKQEMGDTSNQVIPFYLARDNDYFKDVAVWTNGVRYLLANQMAAERYKGKKKLGTYLNAGTVGQALAALNRGTNGTQ